MGIVKAFRIVMKYELLAFKRYILSKTSRLVGFIIGIGLMSLYVFFVLRIVSNPFVKEILLDYRDMILHDMISLSFFLCLLSVSLGFSIVTQIRKGQRYKIDLMLQSPLKPMTVFIVFIIINSLTVALFYLMLAYPPVVAVLLVLNYNFGAIFMFLLLMTMAITGFASIGVAIGILYVKLTRRQKVFLSIVTVCLFAYVYVQIYMPNNAFFAILNSLGIVLNNKFSPFRWIISPLLPQSGVTMYAEPIAGLILPVVIILLISRYLTIKYTLGAIKAPRERIVIKHKYRRGLIYRLFGSEVGGILNKEIKILARDPSMLSGFVFVFIIMIVMLLNLARSPGEDPFIMMFMVLMFSTLLVILSPMMILQVSLALERRNMAILLSSPVKPDNIIAGKALLGEIIAYASTVILIPLLLIVGIDLLSVLMFLALLISIAMLASAISAYVCTKYVDYKAENPRKALRTTGALIIAGVLLVFYIFLPFVLSLVFMSNYRIMAAPLALGCIPLSYYLRRKIMRRAGKILEALEAYNYL